MFVSILCEVYKCTFIFSLHLKQFYFWTKRICAACLLREYLMNIQIQAMVHLHNYSFRVYTITKQCFNSSPTPHPMGKGHERPLLVPRTGVVLPGSVWGLLWVNSSTISWVYTLKQQRFSKEMRYQFLQGKRIHKDVQICTKKDLFIFCTPPPHAWGYFHWETKQHPQVSKCSRLIKPCQVCMWHPDSWIYPFKQRA